MKILELIHNLETAYELYGDRQVEICCYSEEKKKYYWVSSCRLLPNRVIIGYHKDSLFKTED